MEYTFRQGLTSPLRINIDEEGWMEIHMGDDTIDLSPEEVSFLREVINKP